jgi:hypothetical protein
MSGAATSGFPLQVALKARREVLVRPRQHSVLVDLVVVAIIASTIAGCSPLPGASLDPMYLKYGTQPSRAASEPVAPAPAKATAPPSFAGAAVWVGRYKDSRGEGELTLSLVRGGSTISGTWQLRTGGGGPITGMLEANGKRFQLRMESSSPDCPGVFEGWAEISETVFTGTYRGSDCEGPVSDGKLELHPK